MRLDLSLGVIDRRVLCSLDSIQPAGRICESIKGGLKMLFLRRFIIKNNAFPDNVYLFDDCIDNIAHVNQLGVSTCYTKDRLLCSNDLYSLILKEKNDPGSVKYLWIDFDCTLTKYKMKTRYIDSKVPSNFIMGSYDRSSNINFLLSMMERMGIQIGIITMNNERNVRYLLKDMKWIGK